MPSSRPDYDQTLKDLLNRAHDGFLRLILPEASWRQALPPELPSQARHADLLWEVDFHGEPVALHIELQTRPDPDMGVRLAEYGLRILRQHHLKPLSIVVYLTQTDAIPASPFSVSLQTGEHILSYAFRVVRFWEKDPQAVLQSSEYTLWPLTPLMAGADVRLLQQTAEQIAQADLPRMTRVELEGILALFATLRLPKQTIQQTIRSNPMIEDLIKDSGFYDLIKDMVVEDVQKEFVKDKLDTLQRLVLGLAEQHFPDLAAATHTRITATADSSRLEQAILAMNTFAGEAELVAFLTSKQ